MQEIRGNDISAPEFFQRIMYRKDAKVDFVAPAAKMSLFQEHGQPCIEVSLPTGTFQEENEVKSYCPTTGTTTYRLPMNEHAQRQAARAIDMPWKYWQKCVADDSVILADSVDHWLARSDRKHMVRTLFGEARGFLSDRFGIYDDDEILFALAPVIQAANARPWKGSIGETKTFVTFLSDDLATLVGQDSPNAHRIHRLKGGPVKVNAAAILKNSEVGCGQWEISLAIVDSICANKYMGKEIFARRHLGRRRDSGVVEQFISDETRAKELEATVSAASDMLRAAFNRESFEAMARAYEGTANVEVEKPAEAAQVIAKRESMTDREADALLGAFFGHDVAHTGGFGIVNAVTDLAKEMPTAERQSDFERLGGKLIDLKPDQWNAFLTDEKSTRLLAA